MKTNILTKLLALVLAIVMMLGTCVSALAQVSATTYQNVLMAKAVELYEQFMNSLSIEEAKELASIFSEEQAFNYLMLLGEERERDLSVKQIEMWLDAYRAAQLNAEPDIVLEESEVVYNTVSYTNAAPFRAPVSGGQN